MKRFLFLALVFAGCGGGDKMTTSPFPPPQMMTAPPPAQMQQQPPTSSQRAAAVEKCETFVSTWCGRASDCFVATDPTLPRSELVAECKSAFRAGLDCGAAVGVSASFDRCLREMSEMTCNAIMADPPLLPASCNGSILVQ